MVIFWCSFWVEKSRKSFSTETITCVWQNPKFGSQVALIKWTLMEFAYLADLFGKNLLNSAENRPILAQRTLFNLWTSKVKIQILNFTSHPITNLSIWKIMHWVERQFVKEVNLKTRNILRFSILSKKNWKSLAKSGHSDCPGDVRC